DAGAARDDHGHCRCCLPPRRRPLTRQCDAVIGRQRDGPFIGFRGGFEGRHRGREPEERPARAPILAERREPESQAVRIVLLASSSRVCRSGRNTVKRVPRPTSLSTSIRPPCLRTMEYETDKPSPVPWPTGLVVKNGSKIRFMCSAGMPQPVSSTISHASSALLSVVNVTVPCPSIA